MIKNKRRLRGTHLERWKDELHRLNIGQFESPTGPTVPISDNVFELYFDISLQETMVAESNKYAKLAMGDGSNYCH